MSKTIWHTHLHGDHNPYLGFHMGSNHGLLGKVNALGTDGSHLHIHHDHSLHGSCHGHGDLWYLGCFSIQGSFQV